MVGLIRSLSPKNGMSFEDICSFETENFYGIYNHYGDEFLLFAKEDSEMNLHAIDSCNCRSVDELDAETYAICEEHIIGVSTSQKYKFKIIED